MHRVDLRIGVNAPRRRRRPQRAKRTSDLTKCAYGPCEVVFRPRWDGTKWPKYCSKTCANRANSQNPDVIRKREEAAQKARQRRMAEAAACGMTPEEMLEARIEAYWRKVVDPGYYTTLRVVTPQSALGRLA